MTPLPAIARSLSNHCRRKPKPYYYFFSHQFFHLGKCNNTSRVLNPITDTNNSNSSNNNNSRPWRNQSYKYIRPENVHVQYGGLSRPGDLQEGVPKPASEFTVKGGEKVNLEIDGIESGATITWEVVVGGWELEYSAEFVPNAEKSYTIAIQKVKWLAASEEPVYRSFTAKEAGRMVLSVDNTNSRRKKVAAYRYIVCKPTA